MNQELKDIESIENYLDNNLSDDARYEFEQRLARDQNFSELYKELRVLIDGIKYSGQRRRALYRNMQKIRSQMPARTPETALSAEALELVKNLDIKEGTPSADDTGHLAKEQASGKVVSIFNYKVLSAAATIALLLAAGIYYFSASPDTEALFAENFDSPYLVLENRYRLDRNAGEEAPEYIPGTASELLNYPAQELPQIMTVLDRVTNPQNFVDSLYAAYFAYGSEDFEQSANLFGPLTERLVGTERNNALFYLAQSSLMSGHPENAISALERLVRPESDYSRKDQALWYLGLAQLKLNKVEEAKETFARLSRLGTTYGENAVEILKKL